MGQSSGAGPQRFKVAPRKPWWKPESRFTTADRAVAVGLAVVWIGAGLTAIVLGLLRGRWAILLLGTFGLWYGVLWVRAVRLGRRLHRGEGIWPWQLR